MRINKLKQTHRKANLTYVTESERDAEQLRSQVDVPVQVRSRHYHVTIDATAIEGIEVSTAKDSQTSDAPAAPVITQRPAL